MASVRILGGGPAGCAAALQAMKLGADVEIFEKTVFPRHKVCGEFLSPESAAILDRFGVLGAVEARKPARITRMMLCFGGREKHGRLPEAAYGISRHAMDEVLLEHAVARGARLRQEFGEPRGTTVIATGRNASAPRGKRLFGFKAHFSGGPTNDAVELYFLSGRAYVGVNAVEGGVTNVCGLAEEDALRGVNFDVDAFLHQDPSLRNRLEKLSRAWKWLTVGPLVFGRQEALSPNLYPAGDRFSFVDPFTGSGMLSALVTGVQAGTSSAMQWGAEVHSRECTKVLAGPLRVASIFRGALEMGWGHWAAPWIPARLMFRATRPRVR